MSAEASTAAGRRPLKGPGAQIVYREKIRVFKAGGFNHRHRIH